MEKNLEAKVASREFTGDLRSLLAPGIRYDARRAGALVKSKLFSLF
jgi:hypothetical protein